MPTPLPIRPPILHLLGTGAALSDPHRTTTMLAFERDTSLVLVDCGGDVVQRLMMHKVALDKLSAVILTHEHPDHVGGFPLFMEKIWLFGRRDPIPVYGIPPAIDQAKRCLETFDLRSWTDLPTLDWRAVAHQEGALVLEDDVWRITASPGDHTVPIIGLRVEDRASGKVVAYSCDTSYSEVITRLAEGADILVHEATGSGPGHSSATEAATVARDAGVGQLLLVHLPPEAQLDAAQMSAARRVFAATEKGEEGGAYPF